LAQLRARRVSELQTNAATNEAGGPAILTDDSLADFVKSNSIVMVDVWASWCGPCRQMEPIVEELSHEWKGRAAVGKLNADENYESVAKFGVQGIPAFLFFKGGQFAGKVVGARPKRDFNDVLSQLEKMEPRSADADPSVQ
ncbi:MAG TPA: thioredoxin domain-containing protein, partial [Candidatus Thermoplasmatota archaeon]